MKNLAKFLPVALEVAKVIYDWYTDQQKKNQ